MKVLIGCEESQEVCKAFRELGHEAYSNDLKPCSGGHEEWHLQMDVVDAIDLMDWDLIILHPDCTKLCNSGNKHYAYGKPLHIDRIRSANWTRKLFEKANKKCKRVALENPGGCLNKLAKMGKPHYIEPYQFGHPETKKTGLWLHGLPKLIPTNVVSPKKIIGKNGKEYSRIHLLTEYEANKKYGQDRKTVRSKTFHGIAKAMAEQWGGNINELNFMNKERTNNG